MFELDAKAPGMDKLVAMLTQAEGKLKEGHHHLKETESEWKGVGSAVKEASNKLKEFEEAAGIALAIEGVEKMTEAVTELGKEIVETAAKTESLNFSMEVNFGKEGGKEIEEWAERLQKKTPFTAEQIKGWGIELGHAGVAMKDLDKYMFAGLDVAARSADKAQGMANAMEALKRVQLTGHIGGRQLLGLGLPVENLMALPKFHGMKKSQILQNLDKANLTTDDLFRAMTGGKPIGELGADMQNLLETKVKNVKTLPEQYYEKAVDSPAFEPFKGKLDELAEQFNPDSEQGQKILKEFFDVLSSIVDGIKEIDFKELASDVRDFVSAMKDLASVLGFGLHAAGGVIHAERQAVKTQEVQGDIAQQAQESKGIWAGLKAAFSGGSSSASFGSPLGAGGGVADAIAELQARNGENAAKGMVKGASDGVKDVKAAGAELGTALHEGASGPEGIDAHSPSKKFEQLGRWANAGFARGVLGTASMVTDALRSAITIPARAGGGGDVAAGGISLSISGTQVNVHGSGSSHETGTSAAEALFQSIEARFLALVERARRQRGG